MFYTERNSECISLPRNGSERNSESLLLFLFYGTELRVIFSSAEGFGTEFREHASIFDPRNRIPSCFLFRGRVGNGIPRISVPRNSRNSVGNNHLFRQFRLPRNYFFFGNSQPYSQFLPIKPLLLIPYPFLFNPTCTGFFLPVRQLKYSHFYPPPPPFLLFPSCKRPMT